MKKLLLFNLLLVVTYPLIAQKKVDISQFYPIDAGHSYIEFSVKYMGYAKVKGRFGQFSGMFRYDPADVTNTSVTLAINTESIDTDHEFRDNDLKSENWFNAKEFKTIRFNSRKATGTSQNLRMTGDLTMKNVTREVVLRLDPPSGVLKDIRGDAQVIFTGDITINRTDFGVKGANWSGIKEGITAVEDDVRIEFSVLGKQLKAPNFSNWVRNDQRPAGKLYKIMKEQGMESALTEFNKMKSENALDENALVVSGHMLLLEGSADEAIAAFEANSKAFPNSSNVFFNVGEAYATKGDWAKAKESFVQALKLNPENAEALEVLKHIN